MILNDRHKSVYPGETMVAGRVFAMFAGKLISFLRILIIALVAGCATGRYAVDETRNGQDLGQAIETSVDDFFEKRMTNDSSGKPEFQRRWNILYEDGDYVYFGFTQHEFENRDVPIGNFDKLYRVTRQGLEAQFPRYGEIQGYHVENAYWKHIDWEKDLELRPDCGRRNDRQYSLRDNVIEVTWIVSCTNLFFSRGKELVRYTFKLDGNTLELIDHQRQVMVSH